MLILSKQTIISFNNKKRRFFCGTASFFLKNSCIFAALFKISIISLKMKLKNQYKIYNDFQKKRELKFIHPKHKGKVFIREYMGIRAHGNALLKLVLEPWETDEEIIWERDYSKSLMSELYNHEDEFPIEVGYQKVYLPLPCDTEIAVLFYLLIHDGSKNLKSGTPGRGL